MKSVNRESAEAGVDQTVIQRVVETKMMEIERVILEEVSSISEEQDKVKKMMKGAYGAIKICIVLHIIEILMLGAIAFLMVF